MIELTTADKLQNAINKARQQKPRVKVLNFGRYAVQNKETGATYEVICKRHGKRKLAACNCIAGQQNKPCYHVASAVSIHLQLAAERAAQITQ